MSISDEFMLIIIVHVLTGGIFIGGLSMSIKYIEKHIRRLEEKQDRHNNLVERMVKVEESTKAAHHRIDNIESTKR